MAAFETTFILASAFGLGTLHAFEVDHMAAVGAFVAERPRPSHAIRFGVKWACGHALSLLLFGSLVFALKLAVAEDVGHWLERLVGLALFAVGLWSLVKMRAHGVVHTHPHGTGSFWMGMLHGLAGTAAYIGESLVIISKGYWQLFGFTLAFSAGVLAAMAVYALVLGGLLTWSSRRSHAVSRFARGLVGVWSCSIGLFWMLR